MPENSISNLNPEIDLSNDLRLMIVDDDADDVEMLREAAFEIGPDILISTARNGQEALSVLSGANSSLPDIILMDLRMPRLDGRKCLTAIRNDPSLHHIPVVIYTTSQDVQDSVELEALGAVHFISKPSNPEEVYFLLSMVIEERRRELSAGNDGGGA